jgi:hypothetical protein
MAFVVLQLVTHESDVSDAAREVAECRAGLARRQMIHDRRADASRSDLEMRALNPPV